MKALISSDKVPAPPGPYSPGLTVGEWIFLSGQGGFDPNTGKVVSDDLAEQTEQTFNNIETVLEAAGAVTRIYARGIISVRPRGSGDPAKPKIVAPGFPLSRE